MRDGNGNCLPSVVGQQAACMGYHRECARALPSPTGQKSVLIPTVMELLS